MRITVLLKPLSVCRCVCVFDGTKWHNDGNYIVLISEKYVNLRILHYYNVHFMFIFHAISDNVNNPSYQTYLFCHLHFFFHFLSTHNEFLITFYGHLSSAKECGLSVSIR